MRLWSMLPLGLVLLCAPTATAATRDGFPFPVKGGTVVVKTFPGQPDWVQEAVEDSVLMEDTTTQLALDRGRCPTGRLVMTAEKKSTLDRKWAEGHKETVGLAGLFLRGRSGQDCRIWLNARALRGLDEGRLCNLVEHELGHARGLDHTAAGLMQPSLPVLPVDGVCDWAWSDWLDGTDA